MNVFFKSSTSRVMDRVPSISRCLSISALIFGPAQLTLMLAFWYFQRARRLRHAREPERGRDERRV